MSLKMMRVLRSMLNRTESCVIETLYGLVSETWVTLDKLKGHIEIGWITPVMDI